MPRALDAGASRARWCMPRAAAVPLTVAPLGQCSANGELPLRVSPTHTGQLTTSELWCEHPCLASRACGCPLLRLYPSSHHPLSVSLSVAGWLPVTLSRHGCASPGSGWSHRVRSDRPGTHRQRATLRERGGGEGSPGCAHTRAPGEQDRLPWEAWPDAHTEDTHRATIKQTATHSGSSSSSGSSSGSSDGRGHWAEAEHRCRPTAHDTARRPRQHQDTHTHTHTETHPAQRRGAGGAGRQQVHAKVLVCSDPLTCRCQRHHDGRLTAVPASHARRAGETLGP
jgi:hypothetical protein